MPDILLLAAPKTGRKLEDVMSEMQGCEVSFRQMKEEGFNCRSPIQVALCIASVEDSILEDFIEGEEGADKFNMATYIDGKTKTSWAFLKRTIDEETCIAMSGSKNYYRKKEGLLHNISMLTEASPTAFQYSTQLQRKRNKLEFESPAAAYFGCKDETCDDPLLDLSRKLTFERHICPAGNKMYNKRLEKRDLDSRGYRPVEMLRLMSLMRLKTESKHDEVWAQHKKYNYI